MRVPPLLRTPATVVWLALVLATLLSWWLGNDHLGLEDAPAAASLGVLALAFAKARFVGSSFMELRDAPKGLRLLFDGYCAATFLLTAGLFLAA